MNIRRLNIAQKMFLGFGIVILIMVAVIGNTYVNFMKESQAVKWNVHTYQVMQASDGLLMSLLNMETSARGYVITGNESFLKPFNNGNSYYEKYYNKLKELTQDNSEQQKQLKNIQNQYKEWLEWEKDKIIFNRKEVSSGRSKLEDLIIVIQSGHGKSIMDNLHLMLEKINSEEQKLLQSKSANLVKMEKETRTIILIGGIIATIAAIIIATLVVRIVVNPVKVVTNTFKEIAEGDVNLEVRLKSNSGDELGNMARYFNIFMTKLKELISENMNESWLTTGRAELNEVTWEVKEIKALSFNIISYICGYLNIQIGAFYIKTEHNTFKMFGSYSYNNLKGVQDEFNVGEGLIGQSALEKKTILVQNVPQDYIKIISGIGEAVPKDILIVPCIYHGEVECIMELGSFNEFTDIQLKFIEQVSGNIAISVNLTKAQRKMKELLDKTLVQTEELQVQQEELRQNNEELEEQANVLKQSEMNLQTQQEELRVSNEELEEQTRKLEQQKIDIIENNELLREANYEIEEKVKELEVANKYKSQFLANMSHELKTPLNSILVLSQLLANKKGNEPLTEKQLGYAETIHSSGENLLKLINDILDLSKVEAGKLDINFEKVELMELVEDTKKFFNPIALQKKIDFKLKIEKGLPKEIISDKQRIQQIVNNLLSNAFKFTNNGCVNMNICRPKVDDIEGFNIKDDVNDLISIEVTDTGIGIPIDKQKLIFEAFKQVDGTISRKYGGTGLGLSISKELAHLLGGTIYLKSQEGVGSTFTLVILNNGSDFIEPVSLDERKHTYHNKFFDTNLEKMDISLNNKIYQTNQADYEEIQRGDEKLLLIIENDEKFLGVLSELADKKDYKVLTEKSGEKGIELAIKYRPDAILIDTELPDINGWKVIDRLKNIKQTENIPVHIISGEEEEDSQGKFKNSVGYLRKPVDLEQLYSFFSTIESSMQKDFKKILILDRNREQRDSICNGLSERGFQVTVLESGLDAYNLLKIEQFDCMILDLELKDMSGLEFLDKLKYENMINFHILIHTENNITQEDEAKLNKYAESIIIKGKKSTERLLDEASLFFHSVDLKMDNEKIKRGKLNDEVENSLINKKILIVDDDMRNVFSLTNALEEEGMDVIIARNGTEGIKKLQENLKIELIIMDVMMPEMDGYTAMKKIRKQHEFKDVPIIAITAKAMKDDREKCIEAGANDYLTKPVEIDKLISLLKVWLYR